MTTRATDRDRALSLYARLLALYPKPHRDEFGPQMQRAFEDSYVQATKGERRVGADFWLAVLWDASRSIVRERAAEPNGDVFFFLLVAIWVSAVLVVPDLSVVGDWHHLVVPTGVLALLFLTVPGNSGLVRRLATVIVALAVFECLAVAQQSMHDDSHLLAPALLVACMAFSIKTLSGLNARIVGIGDGVWSREELTYGALVGLAGVAGLVLGLVDMNDNNLAGPVAFLMVVPFLCAVAGFRRSARTLSMRAGIYAVFGSLLIGSTIWILALPLVIDFALLTVLRDHQVPAATLLPSWQQPLSSYLFWAAVIGLTGAFFGQITREDGTATESPSPPNRS